MPKDIDLSTLGGRLRYVREELLEMSTKQLADAIGAAGVEKGASDGSVSRYETGKRSPTVEYAVAVAAMAHISPAWIAEGGYRLPGGELVICAPDDMPMAARPPVVGAELKELADQARDIERRLRTLATSAAEDDPVEDGDVAFPDEDDEEQRGGGP